MANLNEIKGIYSDWKDSGNTEVKDKVFDVKLIEDEVDMCVHAINELCGGYIKEGYLMENPQIQSYLALANKLDRLFIEQK